MTYRFLHGLLHSYDMPLDHMDITASNKIARQLEAGRRERSQQNRAAALIAFEAALLLDPYNSQLRLEVARELRALDRLDEASTAIADILEKEPQQVEALIERGYLLRRNGDRKAAAASFTAAAETDAKNLNIRIELVRDLCALGRIDQANEIIDGILDQKPDHPGALIERGRIHRRRGDHVAALTAFRAASAADPKNQNIQVELVRDLRSISRLDEADAILDSVLKDQPAHPGALVERGHICKRRGDHQNATIAFKAASIINPENGNIKVELVRELIALERVDEADAVLSDLLRINPCHVGALVERAHIRKRQRKYQELVQTLQAAAAAAPHNQHIQLELARELRALARFEEAESILARMLHTAPRQFGALVERGHVQRARTDHGAALAAFQEAAEVQPENVNLQLEIATSLSSLGRLCEAEEMLRKLVISETDGPFAAVRLAILLTDTNRLDEAEKVLKDAIQRHPDDYRVLAGLGRLARRQGDRSAALQYFQSATRSNANSLDLKLHVAAELREQRQFDNAFVLIREVLDKDEDHWAAWMQLGHYYRAKDDSRSAINAFRTAVAKQPHYTQALVDLAQEYWASGNPKEADQLLAQARAQEPTHLATLLVSADRAIQTEAFNQAVQIAERAIQSHPGQLGAYLVAARANAYNLDLKAALKSLENARAIFGPLPDITAAQIHVLRHHRCHDKIRSLIESSDDSADVNFAFWVESTSFAITVGDFDRALKKFNSAPAQSTRELARVEHLKAQLAEGRRQYLDAVASYRQALSLEPRNGGWHSEMARAYLLLGDLKNTREELKSSFGLDTSTKLALGQSLNISQHHTGQLLDEFAIEPALIARLVEASALPTEGKLEELKQLVRQHSDHTGPALFLLLALRQSGVLSSGKTSHSTTGAPKIPRRIVQYWNNETLPQDIKKLTDSWQLNHQDYVHFIFDDSTAEKFITTHYPPSVKYAFHRAQEPAQRADVFRLAYLAAEGGFYIDIDDRCQTHLDDFVPASSEFFAYQENYGTIANNVLGSTPRHPVILGALHQAVAAVNRGDRDLVWLSTGPGLLTRAFAQLVAKSATSNWLDNVTILELFEAQRLFGLHCPAAYKMTEKHWSRAVFKRNVAAGHSSEWKGHSEG